MPQRLIDNRWVKVSQELRSRPLYGYSLAFILAVIAFTARLLLDPFIPSHIPYYTFFPAVMILFAAFFCGTRPAILCLVVSVLLAQYALIEPLNSFKIASPHLLPLFLFIIYMAINLYVVDFLNRLIVILRQEKQVTNGLLELQRTMFQELQHRVANNLGFVSNLLGIQKGRVADNPVAQAVLDDARIRLEMMSRVHRRLYDPTNIDLPISEHLRILCKDIIGASGAEKVTCDVDVPDVKVDLEKMLNISLVVIEAVTNSLKHAFTDGREGHIRITMISYGLAHYILTVQDNGKGFPKGFDPAKSDRLGFKILLGFARSLNGEVDFGNENGGRVKLTFAA